MLIREGIQQVLMCLVIHSCDDSLQLLIHHHIKSFKTIRSVPHFSDTLIATIFALRSFSLVEETNPKVQPVEEVFKDARVDRWQVHSSVDDFAPWAFDVAMEPW